MIILAGDIGGTHSRLAVIELEGDKVNFLCKEVFKSKNFESFLDVLKEFKHHKEASLIEAICIGVPGPVNSGIVSITNLPWVIRQKKISELFSINNIWLINDLEAISYGLELLKEIDKHTILPGSQNAVGGQAVIAPGTGLGEAILYWDGKVHWPFATEGGHCGFSPSSELQIKLLEYLMKKFEHVSWERILSGAGLFNIYEFLVQSKNAKESTLVSKQLSETDPAIVITQSALKNEDEACMQTVDLFLDLLAEEAGNLALKGLAREGVYIGGGIAPRLIKLIKPDKFKKAFTSKGRMSDLLMNIPVHIILSDDIGMRGAARCALMKLKAMK